MAHLTSSSSSTYSEEESEKEDMIVRCVNNMLIMSSVVAQQTQRVICRRYIHRERQEGDGQLSKYYFADNPIYDDNLFRRRFRMRQSLFNRILESTLNYDQFFLQRQDATETFGLSPHQKITVAIRCLAYGSSADAVDAYVRIGETTVSKIVHRFCVTIVNIFGPQYLRTPNADDIQRLLKENKSCGFPAMLGSVDCMHWAWKNYPAAWHGQYTDRVREPTIILEAVASYDLWFWHSFFGIPGYNNDLNVFNRSTLFNDLLDGSAPLANFTINNHNYDMGYYLADGIYPPIGYYSEDILGTGYTEEIFFPQMLEAAKNYVKRAFGILQARFGIIRGPARFWDANSLSYIMKTCIILHKMIVEDEREDGLQEYAYDQCTDSSFNVPNRTVASTSAIRLARNVELHDRQKHYALRQDLVEHI